MSVKTQGTQLYVIDPDDDSVLTVGCVVSLSGITATRDQIETTCLESAARTYVAGMATPGTASFTINFDPADASHERIHELYVAGTDLQFAVGWSDGVAPPTADSDGDLVLPTTRTWVTFGGFISDFPFEFSQNAVVTSSVSIQVSGFPTLVKKV